MTPERQAASPTTFSPGRLIGGGRLTAGFGFSQGRLHPGLVVESETMNRPAEVRSPVSGTVEFAGGGLGSVAVRDGRAYLHQLVYLEGIRAKPGQVVRAGEVVGAAAKVYYQVTDPAGIPLDPVTQCRYAPAPSAATGHAAGAPSPSAVGSASSAAPVGAFAAATGHAAGAAGPAAVGSASWDGPSDDVPDDDLPDDDVGDPPGDSGGASSLGGGGSQPGGSPDPPPGPGLPGPEPPEDDEPPEEEEEEEREDEDEEEEEEEREDEDEDQESEEQASSAQGTGGPATGSSKGSPSACANRLDGLEAMAKTIEGSGPGPGSGSIQARRATGAAARVLASRLQLVATTATEAESLGEELLARLKARTAETYAAKAAALTAYIAHARTVGAGAQTLVGRAVALASRMEGN